MGFQNRYLGHIEGVEVTGSPNAFDTLSERGFVKQASDSETLRSLLGRGPVTFYVGFDATADSLHAGSLVPIMAMAHLQRAGHQPVVVIGGGTTMIGDPSGKLEMRRMMSREEIDANGTRILAQLGNYLDFSSDRGRFLNNADWLLPLNYVQFLRDVGRHFRVNEMIKSEAYRQRLERAEGLSFIEFNYQLLQAYDFLVLYRNYGCVLQMGGDDQWGNILAGTDLIRRTTGGAAYALTFPLLTTARGEKMGKTAAGAVWLSGAKMKPFEFYQYWINTDDHDVERFLAYFTFLPLDEVRRLGRLEGSELRAAKEVLAFEATRLAHGDTEAERARAASRAAFGGDGTDLAAVPTSVVDAASLQQGVPLVHLLCRIGLTPSRGEARRLIQQGGIYLNGVPITEIGMIVDSSHLKEGALMIRSGKKKHHRVVER